MDTRNNAAINIQSTARRYLARNKKSVENNSVKTIQKVVRGHLARNKKSVENDNSNKPKEIKAPKKEHCSKIFGQSFDDIRQKYFNQISKLMGKIKQSISDNETVKFDDFDYVLLGYMNTTELNEISQLLTPDKQAFVFGTPLEELKPLDDKHLVVESINTETVDIEQGVTSIELESIEADLSGSNPPTLDAKIPFLTEEQLVHFNIKLDEKYLELLNQARKDMKSCGKKLELELSKISKYRMTGIIARSTVLEASLFLTPLFLTLLNVFSNQFDLSQGPEQLQEEYHELFSNLADQFSKNNNIYTENFQLFNQTVASTLSEISEMNVNLGLQSLLKIVGEAIAKLPIFDACYPPNSNANNCWNIPNFKENPEEAPFELRSIFPTDMTGKALEFGLYSIDTINNTFSQLPEEILSDSEKETVSEIIRGNVNNAFLTSSLLTSATIALIALVIRYYTKKSFLHIPKPQILDQLLSPSTNLNKKALGFLIGMVTLQEFLNVLFFKAIFKSSWDQKIDKRETDANRKSEIKAQSLLEQYDHLQLDVENNIAAAQNRSLAHTEALSQTHGHFWANVTGTETESWFSGSESDAWLGHLSAWNQYNPLTCQKTNSGGATYMSSPSESISKKTLSSTDILAFVPQPTSRSFSMMSIKGMNEAEIADGDIEAVIVFSGQIDSRHILSVKIFKKGVDAQTHQLPSTVKSVFFKNGQLFDGTNDEEFDGTTHLRLENDQIIDVQNSQIDGAIESTINLAQIPTIAQEAGYTIAEEGEIGASCILNAENTYPSIKKDDGIFVVLPGGLDTGSSSVRSKIKSIYSYDFPEAAQTPMQQITSGQPSDYFTEETTSPESLVTVFLVAIAARLTYKFLWAIGGRLLNAKKQPHPRLLSLTNKMVDFPNANLLEGVDQVTEPIKEITRHDV